MDALRYLENGQEEVGLEDLYRNDGLYVAYPSLSYALVTVRKWFSGTGINGSWNKGNIEISPDMLHGDFAEAKKVLIHEIQHAVQEREGFARGGSPWHTPGMIKEQAEDARSPLYHEMSTKHDELYNALGAMDNLMANPLRHSTQKEKQEQWRKVLALTDSLPEAQRMFLSGGVRIPRQVKNASYELINGMFWKERERYAKQLNEYYKTDYLREYDRLRDRFKKVAELQPYDVYHRLSGEIEARAASEKFGHNSELAAQGMESDVGRRLSTEFMDERPEDAISITEYGEPLELGREGKDLQRLREELSGILFQSAVPESEAGALRQRQPDYIDHRFVSADRASLLSEIREEMPGAYNDAARLTDEELIAAFSGKTASEAGRLLDEKRLRDWLGGDFDEFSDMDAFYRDEDGNWTVGAGSVVRKDGGYRFVVDGKERAEFSPVGFERQFSTIEFMGGSVAEYPLLIDPEEIKALGAELPESEWGEDALRAMEAGEAIPEIEPFQEELGEDPDLAIPGVADAATLTSEQLAERERQIAELQDARRKDAEEIGKLKERIEKLRKDITQAERDGKKEKAEQLARSLAKLIDRRSEKIREESMI